MDTDTPRTDEALNLHYSEGDYFGEETTKAAYEFARELERELNEMANDQLRADEAATKLEELREAVRNFRDVKGRFHTQLAAEYLIALLPTNDKIHP